MSDQVEFKNLFAGQEIEDFVKQFINPEHVSLPKNTAEVLADIKTIWQAEGFISPAQLKATLINKYLGEDAPQSLKDLVNNIELSRNMCEKVTGFLGREHTYLATGLAHLYSKSQLDKIFMIEIDFSNMGGTNEYFKQLLAKENNISIEDVKDYKAEALTDKAAFVVAGNILKTLAENLSSTANIIPIRSGGDELRIFFSGDIKNISVKNLTDKLHTSIEKVTAKMGLHDHKHLKAPNNPDRNGFGAALTIKDISSINNHKNLIHELDAEIKAWKYIIGKVRHGEIDEDFAKEEIKYLIKDGILKTNDMPLDDFIKSEVPNIEIRVKKIAAMLKSIKPDDSFSTKDFEAYVEIEKNSFNKAPLISQKLKDEINIEKLSDDELESITPFMPIKQRREFLAERFLNNNAIVLNNEQKYLLNLALNDLAIKDPSSDMLMPKEIIIAIDAYKKDIEDFNFQTSSEEFVTPYIMGTSFHGLASLNDVFGHQVADGFLKYFAQNIIKESIAEEVVCDKEKLEDVALVAHHGGGNFTILLKPEEEVYNQGLIKFSDEMLEKISHRIKEKTEQINSTRVDEFFLGQGIRIEKEDLDKNNIKYFSDLDDSKEREFYFGNKVFYKKIKGIQVASDYKKIEEDDRRGGERVISDIRTTVDEKLEMVRACIALKEELKNPTSPKKLSNNFRT